VQEKLRIKNRKGLEIVGVLSMPENPIGLAFTLHGLGGFKEQPGILAIADTLFLHNFIVVNFDATNSVGESEGKYEDATMQLHYEDLVDVINWAKTQNWYKEPFLLAGHSLGGYAVARYAEDYPTQVKAVFPFALVVAGELSHKAAQIFNFEELKKWKETGWQERESVSKPGFIKKLPWSHMEERLKHDLLPDASKITMPALFIVGENDTSCTPNDQKILYDLVPGPKEMHIIKGAPHTFRDSQHLSELKEIFDKWLGKIKNETKNTNS
jgi:pimeloyl-ACP methyl ester carboxylesterase